MIDSGVSKVSAKLPQDGTSKESLSDGTIEEALLAARDRIEQAERAIEALKGIITLAREEEQLLNRLLAIRHGDSGKPALVKTPSVPSSRNVDSFAGLRVARHPAVEEVVSLLEDAGRPLHISELVRLVNQKSVKLPGSGTQANLISHLRRDSRFVRPSRGMYGLAGWGLEEMRRPVKRARRKWKRGPA